MNKVQDVVSIVATSEVGFQEPPIGLVIGEDKFSLNGNGHRLGHNGHKNGGHKGGNNGHQRSSNGGGGGGSAMPRKSISGVSTGPMGMGEHVYQQLTK